MHRAILHSCSDISVLLDLLQCSCGLSGFPSSKATLHTCLIGDVEFLSMQCSGNGPHLTLRGKSHGFSRVAVGTLGIFSSYSGDDP